MVMVARVCQDWLGTGSPGIYREDIVVRKVVFALACVGLLSLVASPAMALPPFTDGFYVTFDEAGAFVEGGGDGYEDGTWYEYPNFGWWNEWFYNDPYDDARVKRIIIKFDVAKVNPGEPLNLELVANWSTGEWAGTLNPLPPLPPLSAGDEVLYIGRSDPVEVITAAGEYEFEYFLPDFNPEWVSVDVRGSNFIITNGTIYHRCLAKIPTVSQMGLIVVALLVVTAGAVVIRRRQVLA